MAIPKKKLQAFMKKEAPAPYRAKDTGEDEEPEGKYHVKIKPDESSVVYEAAFPWTYLKHIEPADGTRFGLNITVFDDDGGGTSKSVSWTPGMFLHRDKFRLVRGFSPELFGDIILKDTQPVPKPDEGKKEPEEK